MFNEKYWTRVVRRALSLPWELTRGATLVTRLVSLGGLEGSWLEDPPLAFISLGPRFLLLTKVQGP